MINYGPKVSFAQQYSIIEWKRYIYNEEKAGPVTVSMLREEVSQVSMIPTPAYHLPSFSLHMWLHEVFPMTTWQEKRKLRSALQMVLYYIQVPPESGQLNPYALFLGHLWRTMVKGTSVRGITPSGASLCSFSLEKWMDKHASIYWFMDFDQWFCWIVTDFETTWLDNWWQRFLERGVWIVVS